MSDFIVDVELNSNDYLQLCDQLKEMNDKREKSEAIMKKKILLYQKHFMSIYGFIRHISDLMDPHEVEGEVYMLIEMLRGLCSDIVEDEILVHTPHFEKD